MIFACPPDVIEVILQFGVQTAKIEQRRVRQRIHQQIEITVLPVRAMARGAKNPRRVS